MTPITHQTAELATYGPVIVRAPETLVVSADEGEPWFADDESPDEKIEHPAVTRWLDSLIVAPAIDVEELDVGERIRLLLAALDAHALAAEWAVPAAADTLPLH
jgi:hypothetical protein